METKPSLLQETLERAELRTRAYSGRGMFGKYCLGVTCGGWGVVAAALVEATAEEPEHAAYYADLLREGVSQDNMGREMIIYFPDVAYVRTTEPCPAGTRCDACNPGTCDCMCHEERP